MRTELSKIKRKRNKEGNKARREEGRREGGKKVIERERDKRKKKRKKKKEKERILLYWSPDSWCCHIISNNDGYFLACKWLPFYYKKC